MTKILSTQDVSKRFGGLKALTDVSITMQKRKIIGLIGPNGSGKSTLFNIITNIFPPDRETRGTVLLKGNKIDNLKTHKIAQSGLLRTFQTTQIFQGLSVLENMLIAAQNHPGESFITVIVDALITNFKIHKLPILKRYLSNKTWQDEEKKFAEGAMEILNFLEIAHLAHEKAEVLSGGQRKLLALGRALMAAGDIILLDEPVAGVNPSLSNRIFDKIDTIRNEGTTFFIIEHNMDVIMDSSDEVWVLSKGELIAHGTPDEIQKNPKVLSAYLGETED